MTRKTTPPPMKPRYIRAWAIASRATGELLSAGPFYIYPTRRAPFLLARSDKLVKVEIREVPRG